MARRSRLLSAVLVELLAFAAACRRAAAARVAATFPYFGYSPSEKRHGRRELMAANGCGKRSFGKCE